MTSIVKSLRVTDHVLAACYEASHKLGLEPNMDTEALRIAILSGLTAILGPEWQHRAANPDILHRIRETSRQVKNTPLDASTIQARMAQVRSAPKSELAQIDIEPILAQFSPEEQDPARRIWTLMADGTISPQDQLEAPEPIGAIARKLLELTGTLPSQVVHK